MMHGKLTSCCHGHRTSVSRQQFKSEFRRKMTVIQVCTLAGSARGSTGIVNQPKAAISVWLFQLTPTEKARKWRTVTDFDRYIGPDDSAALRATVVGSSGPRHQRPHECRADSRARFHPVLRMEYHIPTGASEDIHERLSLIRSRAAYRSRQAITASGSHG